MVDGRTRRSAIDAPEPGCGDHGRLGPGPRPGPPDAVEPGPRLHPRLADLGRRRIR